MRVLFFGTAQFAVPTLKALFDSDQHEILGIVSQPDRPSGRGLQLQQSPVKRAALEHDPNILVLQPERARRKEFVAQVAEIAPDALVVAAFGQILPQRLLDLPRYGGINVHGSLLPRWRGAAPMQYCLMAGDAETGVTTMQMDAGMDTGGMLLKASTLITPDDTVDTIEERLSALGAPLLIETLRLLELGACPREKQDDTLATFCPPLPPDIGYLNWNLPATELANLIRGVTPRPGAWAFFGGKRIKVWAAHVEAAASDASAPGEVVASDKNGIAIAAGACTALRLESVQPEGKPKMQAADWARGARVAAGVRFDAAPITAD